MASTQAYEMELKTESSSIADLDGYLKLHEIFGLQFFSLKSDVKKEFKHQRSILRTSYFLALTALVAVFGCALLLNSSYLTVTTKNVLTILYEQWLNYFIIATHFSNFVQSFVSSRNFIGFFKNSETVADYCRKEFKLEMNISSVCRAAWIQFSVVMLAFVTLLSVAAYTWSDNLQVLVITFAFYFLLFGQLTLVVVKFIFYICFVNYQLRYQQKILFLSFKRNNMKSISDGKVSDKLVKKLVIVCRVYSKIRQNAAIVNKSTGLTMALMLVVTVMTATYAGYEFCRIVIDRLSYQIMASSYNIDFTIIEKMNIFVSRNFILGCFRKWKFVSNLLVLPWHQTARKNLLASIIFERYLNMLLDGVTYFLG